MALTIRLSEDEQGLLRVVQAHSGTKTASATIKYMLKHHQNRLNMINGLENQLSEAHARVHILESNLTVFKKAWCTLEMIAKPSPRVDPESSF